MNCLYDNNLSVRRNRLSPVSEHDTAYVHWKASLSLRYIATRQEEVSADLPVVSAEFVAAK